MLDPIELAKDWYKLKVSKSTIEIKRFHRLAQQHLCECCYLVMLSESSICFEQIRHSYGKDLLFLID